MYWNRSLLSTKTKYNKQLQLISIEVRNYIKCKIYCIWIDSFNLKTISETNINVQTFIDNQLALKKLQNIKIKTLQKFEIKLDLI